MQEFVLLQNKKKFLPTFIVLHGAPEIELFRRVFWYSCYPHIAVSTAAKAGYANIVRYKCEIEHDCDNHALLHAIFWGRMEIVRYLYEKGFRVYEPLRLAVNANQWAVAEFLIEREESGDVNSVLNRAAQYGKLKLVRGALQRGANANNSNSWALRLAAAAGHVDIVSLLLLSGARPHREGLKFAARRGHLKVAQLLVDAGADLEGALERAVRGGHLNIVRFLVERGADIHAHQHEAFCLAVDEGHAEIIRFLVRAGVDPGVNRNYGLRRSTKRELVQFFSQ